MAEMRLKELLEIKKENKKLTRVQQREYCKELKELLADESAVPDKFFYVVSCAANGSVRAFTQWCAELSEERQVQELKQLLRSKEVSALQGNQRYRFLLCLLSGFLSNEPQCHAAIKMVMKWIPDAANKKDGTYLEELSSSFKAYFFEKIPESVTLPDLSQYSITEAAIAEFFKWFDLAINDIQSSKAADNEKKARLLEWMSQSLPKPKKDSNDAELGSPALAKEKIETVPNKSKEAMVASKGDTEKKYRSKVAKKLMAIANEWELMTETFVKIQSELSDKDQIIEGLNGSLNSAKEELVSVKRQLTGLKLQLDEASTALEVAKKEKTELETRVSVQASVLNVYADDKKNAQEEQLNAIAASLVRPYKEYCEARTLDMSTDMEMTLMDLLEDIFKRLEKSGIDIRGRL